MSRGIRIGAFLTATIVFGMPFFVHAQVLAPFTLSLNPTYPAPFAPATVSVQSSLLDLSASTMTASANGVQIYSGNVQSFPVTLGAPGTPVNIQVTITTSGQKNTESISVNPGSVSLELEPQATAAPLYAGRPNVPLSGTVRAVAIADFRTAAGAPIDPSTLSYTWNVDGTTFQNNSGIGKTSVFVTIPLQYRARTVSVVVKTPNGTEVGGGTANISSGAPTVLVYQNDPLLGILFDHAISNSFTLSGSELSFLGVPFSFSTQGGGPALSWSVGGSNAQTGNSLTLRPQGSGQGTAAVSFSASNIDTRENAAMNFSLTFGSAKGGGLFGL